MTQVEVVVVMMGRVGVGEEQMMSDIGALAC